jgi:phosphate transport system substrate-binding protein
MKISHFHAFVLSYLVFGAGPVFGDVSLKGSGSVLGAPLFLRWTAEYHRLHPEIKLRYEEKNSTDGIERFQSRGSEFGATDSPLTEGEERKTLGRPVLHLPVAIEAVAITYNLPAVPGGIKLSPGVLSKIFMGAIRKWNDIAITELNPGVTFPNMDILVIHRADESSLHDLFPGILAKLDPQWTLKREKDKSLKWPVGENVGRYEKVMEKIRKWPGVIAAVNFSFASQNHLPVAQLKNTTGHYVDPSEESLQAATSDLVSLPEDGKVILGRSRSPKAYPLCGFCWLLAYQDGFRATHDHKKAQALVDFFNWIFSDGQKLERDLAFVPLPDSFNEQMKEKVKTIKY